MQAQAKYGNQKTKQLVGSQEIVFDSKVEAARYQELATMQKFGLISHLELQPEYELQAGFKRNKKAYRRETYKADFRYQCEGKTVLEDVKGGILTALYKSKLKRLLYLYPEVQFFEVYKKNNEWVTVEK